jgi:hypothetical protein
LRAEQRDVVESAAYLGLKGPTTALAFLRWAQLCRDSDTRGEALLQAAWTADDAAAAADATAWRLAAAEAWGEPSDPERALRLLDVLRRASAFERARALAGRFGGLDESSARVVAFQLARIAEGDIGRHLMSSALRPPAHRPHVAHQAKPEKRGFWRLFTGRG